MKVLLTGSSGFIGGYIANEFLNHGYEVVGIDNYTKYGEVEKDHDNHPKFTFVKGDCTDQKLMNKLSEDADYIIAGAAMIGGISYFHQYAYDLMANNERILASTFDAAINAYKNGKLKRIIVLSSSMVYENAKNFPTKEGEEKSSPPPFSTYGFQKLAAEYFAYGAYEQHKLPYTIVRPFNCVGLGEGKALGESDYTSGSIKLALSHVLPDLIQKVIKGQDPLRVLGNGEQVRCYTHGKDLARGIRMATESDKAENEDFNISTSEKTSVKRLAEIVWREVHGDSKPFRIEHDEPFQYDVQYRVPDVTKAKDFFGFEAKIPVKDTVKEVAPWIREQIEKGFF